MKEKSKQKVKNFKAMKIKGRMQIGKGNTIQTIQQSKVLLLIQWSWVTIEVESAFLQRQ